MHAVATGGAVAAVARIACAPPPCRWEAASRSGLWCNISITAVKMGLKLRPVRESKLRVIGLGTHDDGLIRLRSGLENWG